MSADKAIPAMRMCPLCGAKGQLTRKREVRKDGVSRSKLAVAILTLGITLLIPGMRPSRSRKVTHAHCGACNATWEI